MLYVYWSVVHPGRTPTLRNVIHHVGALLTGMPPTHVNIGDDDVVHVPESKTKPYWPRASFEDHFPRLYLRCEIETTATLREDTPPRLCPLLGGHGCVVRVCRSLRRHGVRIHAITPAGLYDKLRTHGHTFSAMGGYPLTIP